MLRYFMSQHILIFFQDVASMIALDDCMTVLQTCLFQLSTIWCVDAFVCNTIMIALNVVLHELCLLP
jgi:hypothetical protein